MIDITERMLDFKEGVRHIWNTYFSGTADPLSPDIQEAFSSIERAMLRVIVLAPYGVGDLADSYRLAVSSNILIKPARFLTEMPIQFGRKEANGNTVWDNEILIKVDANTKFGFFDFFDWRPTGHIDLPFVRVRELPCADGEPHAQRIALIEQIYCEFMLVTN